MSDCQTLPVYSRSVRTGVPSYVYRDARDATSKELVRSMFARSIQSIRQGSAIYRQMASKHRPIVIDAEDKQVHACFCPRPNRLPPIETWMASVSYFVPDGMDVRYAVVDRAAIILPTTLDNFSQQVDIGLLMFAYLKQELECEKVLYPAVTLEEEHTGTRANTAVSVHAVNKIHQGKVELKCGGRMLHFYKL